MARYADDFAAVVDAVARGSRCTWWPTTGVRLGMWEYLARPEASERVASFTSVSGPGADHVTGT